MLQEFPFKSDTIHLKCEGSHIQANQDKYRAKKNVVSSCSFFMRDQKDADK